MRKYIFLFLITFLFHTNAYSENIDTLLNIYAKENDLSNKTIKEAAGNVIVYTRQDLEKMQVKSLSELLKNIPFIRYNENRLGYTDLSYGQGRVTTSSDARVYINERELTSPFYGNGLGIISKFDIAYVDHVEIYYGVTSFEFGVEPSNIVVKLYTKDPNRENGGEIKTSYSSYNSKEGNLSYGSVFKNYSLYTYLNKKNTNEKKVQHEGTDLSRDKESLHLFLSLQNDTNRLEYNRIEAKSDLFSAGLGGGDGSPNTNNTDVTYNLLGWYSSWLENKLSLSLDYIYIDKITKQADDEALGLLPPFNIPYYKYTNETNESQLSATIKYKQEIKNHNILTGLQYRDKNFKRGKVLVNDIPLTTLDSSYNNEKIYGAFIEDNYLINENNLILASIKYDWVKPNGSVNDQNLLLYRLGYIYKEDEFKAKTFYTSTQKRFDANFYYNLTATDTNDDLNHQEDNRFSIELNWDKYPYNYGLSLFNLKQKNKLYLDGTVFKNSDKPYNTKGISLTHSYYFDKLNRIDTNFFIMNEENKQSNFNDTVHGGYVRLFNSFGKFDLYNELIYRNGYEGLDLGIDYSAAITYKYTRDLRFSLKGENIFNSAIETKYTETDPINGTNTIGPMSMTSKRFWFTMEYRF